MIPHDAIGLSRDQHAELYGRDGELRLVVDHPSNSPLIGTHARAPLVRAAVLTPDSDDGRAVVYAGRGGAACRIATARVARRKGGHTCLTDWQLEPGFDHAAGEENGGMVHRVNRSARSDLA